MAEDREGTNGVCRTGGKMNIAAQKQRGNGYRERACKGNERTKGAARSSDIVPTGRSPDEAPVVESAFPARFPTLALGKCVPEAKRLVPSARDDRLAVGTHRKVEHAASVARERYDHV